MRLQSAIFDMDGTLLDSMPIWRDLGTSVLRGLGIEPEPETSEMLKTLSLRHGIAYCKEHYHLPQTEEELIGRVVGRVADFYQNEVQAKPGVEKFLSLLKMEGVWMYVATATDRPLAEAALRRAGIDHYFRGLITVAEVGVGKRDSAEIYERAMRRLQSNKKDTVVFEDAFHAIRTAKAAGFRVAAVYDASEEANQPAIREMADYYIRSFVKNMFRFGGEYGVSKSGEKNHSQQAGNWSTAVSVQACGKAYSQLDDPQSGNSDWRIGRFVRHCLYSADLAVLMVLSGHHSGTGSASGGGRPGRLCGSAAADGFPGRGIL